MFRLLGLTLCLALFPPLHLCDVCNKKGLRKNVTCYDFSSLCESAVNCNLEYDKHAVLREGQLPEMDSCESLTVSGLQYIESGGFKGLENITTLIIQQDFFNIIERGMFKYLDNLEKLVIGGNYNKIFKLEDEAFHNLGNLVNLTLSHNSIPDIQKAVFKGLENVTDLDLSYNELQKLGEFSFSHLHSLNYINLRKNKLIRVSRKAFYNLTNLQEIDLQHNSIKAIEEPLFRIDEIIVAINLIGNPLRCDCRMEWISSWLDMSARKCYGKCDSPEDMTKSTLYHVYNASRGLLQCPTNNSVITQKRGTLLELPCTLVDCIWTTPDGTHVLSKHGERQGPYFLTNYDALIIDSTNTAKSLISGSYSYCSLESEGQVLKIKFRDGWSTLHISALASVCSVIVVILFKLLVSIIKRYDRKTKRNGMRCSNDGEKAPLLRQDCSHASRWEEETQNSPCVDDKFYKSPSLENSIAENFDDSGSYNSNSGKEYLKEAMWGNRIVVWL